MTAFVNSYSFSHRFSGKADGDTAGYREVIHQCQEVNATALAREFFCFATGCGYSQQSMVEAFGKLVQEYGNAYCYDGENAIN